ncbi:DNA-directed RNA polymerase subunit omega [Pseudalkalibacillus salsuginis]|uniref:DNA-directed RNA polymerase subunit omega n=1 Tax=Pseudalkalibacillus salsuginis TaxID=2910972 RepID=UPI001F1CD811|nr:DNA-directed RNA polymerase subunit omega [Pseudalkalibacillus salsuginis]MCF6410511.1 DNA-directed RNA polymerase subunit omega [Pseudalkalibacillus salsuginis]
MLYPSIDSLMEKLDSKYTLVTVSSKRARMIQQSSKPLVDDPKSSKFVGIALEEILEGKLTYDLNKLKD